MTHFYSDKHSSGSMSLNSIFKSLLDEATYHRLAGPNRDIIMRLCDFICNGNVKPNFALENLKETLYSPDTQVVLQSLQILQAWVNNCGTVIHKEVASKAFMEELTNILRDVRNRILGMLQSWEYMFHHEPCYRAVHEAVERIKNQGYTFPELKDEDVLFTVDQDYRNVTLAHQVLSKNWKEAAASNLVSAVHPRSESSQNQVQCKPNTQDHVHYKPDTQEQVHYEPNSNEELLALRDKVSCSICMENDKDSALVPCGHQFCRSCIDAMKVRAVKSPFQCPVCKTAVQSTIRVYL